VRNCNPSKNKKNTLTPVTQTKGRGPKSIKYKVDVDIMLSLSAFYVSNFKRLYLFKYLSKTTPRGVVRMLRRVPYI